jgi:hypothetical protein
LPEDEQEREETVTELRLIPRDSGACKYLEKWFDLIYILN